ncbi:unnamed protein product [Caenorhabditis brenneri]
MFPERLFQFCRDQVVLIAHSIGSLKVSTDPLVRKQLLYHTIHRVPRSRTEGTLRNVSSQIQHHERKSTKLETHEPSTYFTESRFFRDATFLYSWKLLHKGAQRVTTSWTVLNASIWTSLLASKVCIKAFKCIWDRVMHMFVLIILGSGLNGPPP